MVQLRWLQLSAAGMALSEGIESVPVHSNRKEEVNVRICILVELVFPKGIECL